MPEGWSVEELPAARANVIPGVRTSVQAESKGDTVTVRSSLELTASDYPSEAYAPIAQAIEEAAGLYAESIVLVKH